MKGRGLQRKGEKCGKNIGKGKKVDGKEKKRIPCIVRRSFVVKLLYRPAIITGRVVSYSTKDTARL